MLIGCGARPAAAATCMTYATGIVFGTYFGTTSDVTGTITVVCPQGTAYQIGLNAGLASGATLTTRAMTGGTGGQASLGYRLFNNASYTVNWGNTSGSGWVTGTGNGSAQAYTIYAQIPANEASSLGSYTDSITASVTGNFTTVTTEFSITATVSPGCTLTANSISFGTYSGSLINSTSIVSVTCTNSTAYNVGLNAGLATGATVTNRSMTGPASALLKYSLFSNSTRTTNWGNTVHTDTVAGTGTGSAQSLTVYGQVPAGQSAGPGSYTDTITATVTY